MSISNTERRLIENEMIFRRSNEKAVDGLDALDAMHIEDGHIDLTRDENLKLHFKCECADEDCSLRIPIPPSEYQDIHEDRDCFIVIPGHQIDPIEKVLKKASLYYVVKKNNSVEEPSGELNATMIDNQ